MQCVLPLCLVAAVLQAQQAVTEPDPNALLLAVRNKMQSALDRMPRYLCTETIDRTISQAVNAKPGKSCAELEQQRATKGWRTKTLTSDRLRLDVAVAAHQEMFSWAGDNKFADQSLASLVQSGATSTGAFSSFLTAIFRTDAATITYDGPAMAAGRPLVRFAFHVARGKSQYTVGDEVHHQIVPFHGTFLLDPATVALVQLNVSADEISPIIAACQISSTLDYGGDRQTSSDVVLPAEVRFHALESDGIALENRTVFSGCHQFTGESSLRFDDPVPIAATTGGERLAASEPIPANKLFTVSLTDSIQTATAAAGDMVTVSLRNAIKGSKHEVLVPSGAVVKGRIVLLQRVYGVDFDSLCLAIQLQTAESGGLARPFRARLDSVIAARPRMVSGPLERYSSALTNAGVLRFDAVGPEFVIGRGTQIAGVTLPAQ